MQTYIMYYMQNSIYYYNILIKGILQSLIKMWKPKLNLITKHDWIKTNNIIK